MQTCVSSLAAFGGVEVFGEPLAFGGADPATCICEPAQPRSAGDHGHYSDRAESPLAPPNNPAMSATTPLAMSISPGALAPFSMEASACWRMVRAWVDGVVYVSPYDCARIGQLTNEHSYGGVPPVGQARSRRYGPPPQSMRQPPWHLLKIVVRWSSSESTSSRRRCRRELAD